MNITPTRPPTDRAPRQGTDRGVPSLRRDTRVRGGIEKRRSVTRGVGVSVSVGERGRDSDRSLGQGGRSSVHLKIFREKLFDSPSQPTK